MDVVRKENDVDSTPSGSWTTSGPFSRLFRKVGMLPVIAVLVLLALEMTGLRREIFTVRTPTESRHDCEYRDSGGTVGESVDSRDGLTGNPSIGVVGFIAREGSSWFMSLLQATQNISQVGKICVMGFEPLDHWNSESNVTTAQIQSARRKFYMALTEIETETEEKWLAWIDRVNEGILKPAAMGRIKLNDYCDRRSKLFILKARIANHFDPDNFSPEESRWFQNFSERFRERNGKVMVISRHGFLHRAATDHTGQFAIRDAHSEEEIEEVLKQNAQVHVDPQEALKDVLVYVRASERVGRVARNLRVPSLTVHYESLLYDYEREMEEVFKFLDIPWNYNLQLLNGQSAFKKVSPDRLCKKVANYREYCEFFRSTPYAGLLDEPCDTECEASMDEELNDTETQ
uniref:Uncharacterized protein n=1 Tax=Compsopogon caeruleus TaxID=31354 RepID=A0A7S1XC16_9RHOD|mmetsp:Transcript_14926/g.30358  ORF Transcript_14926/g.30358 Transcript_14926/m.30358 type:complete len:403 (+) Transcript_14926:53-1261(+)